MDHELERDRQRRSYRLCGFGFSLYGFSLTISALLSVVQLFLMLTGSRRNLVQALGINHFEFGFGAFRVWTRLIASLFLCSAFADFSWRRRSGLLVLLGMVDAVLWAVEHGMYLGLTTENAGHEFLRQSLYMALVWAKFSLISGLALCLSDHVGVIEIKKLGTTTRATITAGTVAWFFFFLEQVDWRVGWPLIPRPWSKELFLFYLATMILTCICLIQTSLLCLIAGRSARHVLRKMSQEDRSFDPWSSPATNPLTSFKLSPVATAHDRQKFSE